MRDEDVLVQIANYMKGACKMCDKRGNIICPDLVLSYVRQHVGNIAYCSRNDVAKVLNVWSCNSAVVYGVKMRLDGKTVLEEVLDAE